MATPQETFEEALQDQADMLDIIGMDLDSVLKNIPTDEIIDILSIDLTDPLPAVNRLIQWIQENFSPLVQESFAMAVQQAVNTAAAIGD